MQPPIPLPIPPEARSDLDTARTLTLVALILEIVFLAIGVFALLFFLVLSPRVTPSTNPAPLGLFAFIFTVLGILGVVWILLTYFLVYVRLREGQVERALGPTLAIAILTLVLGSVIPGILLIIAYVKAKDAHTKILFAPRPPA